MNERLEQASHYWLCTVGPGPTPMPRPLDGVWVGNVLYFGGDPATRWRRNLSTVAARHLAGPTALVGAFTFLVADPTYRFPLVAFVLPMFLRGAPVPSGLRKTRPNDSKVGRAFALAGFASFAAGWLLVFATLAFTVAVVSFRRLSPPIS